MDFEVTAEHIKQAQDEIKYHGITACCPAHQALRPYIQESFTVSESQGRGLINIGAHHIRFTPGLIASRLYVQGHWHEALAFISANGPIKFTTEEAL